MCSCGKQFIILPLLYSRAKRCFRALEENKMHDIHCPRASPYLF